MTRTTANESFASIVGPLCPMWVESMAKVIPGASNRSGIIAGVTYRPDLDTLKVNIITDTADIEEAHAGQWVLVEAARK